MNKIINTLGKQVGVHIPLPLYHYMKLYSKTRGIPMRSIVIQALDAVIDYTIFPNKDDLREELVSRIKQRMVIELGKKGIISKSEQNVVKRAVIASYEQELHRLDSDDRDYVISEAKKSLETGTQLELWSENKQSVDK